MNREELLEALIKEKYGNVFQFSNATGIPYTTIRNIFSRGLEGVGVGLVVKICQALEIDVEALMAGSLKVSPNRQKERVWREHCEDGGAFISDEALMFALFGDSADVSDADLEDVKNYAMYLAERKKKEK